MNETKKASDLKIGEVIKIYGPNNKDIAVVVETNMYMLGSELGMGYDEGETANQNVPIVDTVMAEHDEFTADCIMASPIPKFQDTEYEVVFNRYDAKVFLILAYNTLAEAGLLQPILDSMNKEFGDD